MYSHVKTITNEMDRQSVHKKAVVYKTDVKNYFVVDYFYGGGPPNEDLMTEHKTEEEAIEFARKYVYGETK